MDIIKNKKSPLYIWRYTNWPLAKISVSYKKKLLRSNRTFRLRIIICFSLSWDIKIQNQATWDLVLYSTSCRYTRF